MSAALLLYIIFYVLKTVIYIEVRLKSHDMAELQLLGCLNCAFPVFESVLVPLKMRGLSKFLRFMKIIFSGIVKILELLSHKSLTVTLSRRLGAGGEWCEKQNKTPP